MANSAFNLNEKISQDGNEIYFADAQVTDAYVITPVPAITAYAAGQMFNFKANTANTGACTLNVNALGAKAIKKNHDQDPEDNDIEAGQIVQVIYDGVNFQMTSQVAVDAAAIASQAQMETGTSIVTAVSPGRQQYHVSSPKLWASLNGTGAIALINSYNVTAAVDNGTGDYSFTVDIDFNDALYTVIGSTSTDPGGSDCVVNPHDVATARAAGSFRVICVTVGIAPAASDRNYVDVFCFGDLP